jgi:hypothetical protein
VNLRTLEKQAAKYDLDDLAGAVSDIYDSTTIFLFCDQAKSRAKELMPKVLDPKLSEMELVSCHDRSGRQVIAYNDVDSRFEKGSSNLSFAHLVIKVNLKKLDDSLDPLVITEKCYIPLKQSQNPAVVNLDDKLSQEEGAAGNGDQDDEDSDKGQQGQEKQSGSNGGSNQNKSSRIPKCARLAVSPAIKTPTNTSKKADPPLTTFAGDFAVFDSTFEEFEKVLGPIESIQFYTTESFKTMSEVPVEDCFLQTFRKASFSFFKKNWWNEMVGRGKPCEYPTVYLFDDVNEACQMVHFDKIQRKTVYRSPKECWDALTGYFPLLWAGKDDSCDHWGFSLPILFYQGLTKEVRKLLITPKESNGYGYTPPPPLSPKL